MNRRMVSALTLAALMLMASSLMAAGGGDQAMSLVGAWDVERQMLFPTGPNRKTLTTFHFGGTAVTGDGYFSLHGSWEKTIDRNFVVSFYAMIFDESLNPPQHIGYVKVLVENLLTDKDSFEGRTEVWFLLGTDPLNPLDMFLLEASEDVGRRLRAEGPPS